MFRYLLGIDLALVSFVNSEQLYTPGDWEECYENNIYKQKIENQNRRWRTLCKIMKEHFEGKIM